ncbi:MAG: DNA-binding protein WhiA [Clostridia bacterium]|nr:DNA-binding protein WhiA [Clostridia bacterium]MDD3832090.1 DNA-binding protein WhiA [Clostridia bacterium]
MEKLTFSQQVKNEILLNQHQPPCCLNAFLTAVIMSSELSISQKGVGFCISSINLDFVKYIAQIVDKLYGQQTDILAENVNKNKYLYTITVFNQQILFDCGVLYRDDNGLTQINSNVSPYVIEQECCKKSFVRALFLCCGSVVVPQITDEKQSLSYKMEFALSNSNLALTLVQIMSQFGFDFKSIDRKSGVSVYIQESDTLSDILTFFGAQQCMFVLEDVKIARMLRNQANRQANCDVANINKSIDAAEKQIECIKKLIESGKMNLLDDKLKQMADLRMENASASIAELADMLGITKSGAAHRMNKLIEFAEQEQLDT